MDELPPRPDRPDSGDFAGVIFLLLTSVILITIYLARHAQGP